MKGQMLMFCAILRKENTKKRGYFYGISYNK